MSRKIIVSVGVILVWGLVSPVVPVQGQSAVVEESAPVTEEQPGPANEGSQSGAAATEITLEAVVGVPVGVSFGDFAANFDAAEEVLSRVTVGSLPESGELSVEGQPVTTGDSIVVGQVLVYRPAIPGTFGFDWRGESKSQTATARVNVTVVEAPAVEEVSPVPDLRVETRAGEGRAFEFGELGLPELAGIRVVRVPERGQLTYDGQAELPRVILNADVERLVYTPGAEFTGEDSFGYVGVRADQVESANVGVVTIATTARPAAPVEPTPNVDPEPVPETPQNPDPVESVPPADQPAVPPRQPVYGGNDPAPRVKPFETKVRVVNPFDYALENIQVRLATDSKKAPFKVGSYRLKGSGVVVQEVDTPDELMVTLARIEPGEEVEIINLVETLEGEAAEVEKTVRVDTPDPAGAVVELASLSPASELGAGLGNVVLDSAAEERDLSWKIQWLLGITLLIISAGAVVSLWHRKFVGQDTQERRQLPHQEKE